MAKGAIAKQVVTNKIAEAFGEDYIGEVDKKIYVWAMENGEKVQIALALTCPKVMVANGAAPVPAALESTDGGFNWDDTVKPDAEPAVITADEEANISKLMAELGL
jgi:hypothetical protein